MHRPRLQLSDRTRGSTKPLEFTPIVSVDDRSYLYDSIFSNIAGRSLLNVGRIDAQLCGEALRRGARRAVCIDDGIEDTHQFSAETDPLELIKADFEEWIGDEHFDVVLGLNVLHRMYDPIHALRRMISLRPERIVLEIAIPQLADFYGRQAGWTKALATKTLVNAQSIIAMGSAGKRWEIGDRTFLFTPAAIETLFNQYYRRFEPVRSRRSPDKGRAIIDVVRRNIQTLTVVIGPVAGGKSTLMQRLSSDLTLRRSLSLPDEIPVCTSGRSVHELPTGPIPHVLLHYGLLVPFERSLRTYARDPVCDLFEAADTLNFLVLFTPPDLLRQRLKQRDLNWDKPHNKHQRLYRLYAKPDFLRLWYESWEAFSSRWSHARSLAVVNDETFQFCDAHQWRTIFEKLYARLP